MREIIESDPSGYATESRVRRMMKYLLDTGRISQQEFSSNTIEKRDNKYKELDDKIFDLIKKGLIPREIAFFLNLKEDFVRKRQKEILKNSDLDIKGCRKDRKKSFSEKREKAIKENDDESDRVKYRKEFFELAKAEVSYGNKLQEMDVKMLGRFIIINPKLLTKENLKFVLLQYDGNFQLVTKFLSDVISTYEDDPKYEEYIKNLAELRKYINKQGKIPGIKEIEWGDCR